MIQSFFSFIFTEYAGLADTVTTYINTISSVFELKDTIIVIPERIVVMAQIIPFFFYGFAMLIFIKKRLHILIFRLIYILKFSELWLFLYAIYLVIQGLVAIYTNRYSSDFFLLIENQDLFDNLKMHMSNTQPEGSTPGTGVIESGSSTSTTADVPRASHQSSGAAAAHAHGNALIMTAAIAAGSQIAKKAPTFAGKLGTLASSVGIGGAAIIAKHVVGNLSEGSGKSDI